MKRILFPLSLFCTLLLNGCNFSPGAMMGDVNDNPWDYNSSYSYTYGSSYTNACSNRNISSSDGLTSSCANPGELAERITSINGSQDRLEIEMRRDRATDDFQITSLEFQRNLYYTARATCTEDKGQARTFSQRFVCTLSETSGETTDRFHSMTITNQKCGVSTQYTLPSSCSSYDSYRVHYGSRYYGSVEFPTI